MDIPATERRSKGYSTDLVVSPEQAAAIRRSLYRSEDFTRGRILDVLPQPLTQEDVAFFTSNGYLAANGLLTPNEIQSCKDALSDLLQRKTAWDSRVWAQEEPYFVHAGQSDGPDDPELRTRKLAYFVQIEPRLAAASRHPRLIA